MGWHSLWEKPLKECPVKEAPPDPTIEDVTVVEELAEQESLGIYQGASKRGHKVGGIKRQSKWDPVELTPIMNHILDVQFFNPKITQKELANHVGLSQSRVSAILGSGMYRAKYNLRRIKIERLQHSKVAAERNKFEALRDEMIDAHKKVMEIDPVKHVGKELELEKLKQRSVSDLLRMSTEQLRHIDVRLDGPVNGEGQIGAEVELDTSDPGKAYIRLLGTFRKGTK
jgi:predicted XRE-type DNA-binding protein